MIGSDKVFSPRTHRYVGPQKKTAELAPISLSCRTPSTRTCSACPSAMGCLPSRLEARRRCASCPTRSARSSSPSAGACRRPCRRTPSGSHAAQVASSSSRIPSTDAVSSLSTDRERNISVRSPCRKGRPFVRCHLTDNSDDIRGIFFAACRRIDVTCRQHIWKGASVARRHSVARLDEFIGPKACGPPAGDGGTITPILVGLALEQVSLSLLARMLELVDKMVSNTIARKGVRVRVPLRAPGLPQRLRVLPPVAASGAPS